MRYVGLGFLIPSAVFVGYIMGYGLDRLFGTHFFYIIFVLLGAAGGMIAMVREVQKPTGKTR